MVLKLIVFAVRKGLRLFLKTFVLLTEVCPALDIVSTFAITFKMKFLRTIIRNSTFYTRYFPKFSSVLNTIEERKVYGVEQIINEILLL